MDNQIGTFKHIRVQILYPCKAHCSWCATRRKNPIFRKLYDSGLSEIVHDFYVKVIKKLKPQEVFISGGEPLLYPQIAQFLNSIQNHTKQINLFTSFQFSRSLREQIPIESMPLDKVVLCHTTISFSQKEWRCNTANFPFDLYVENIQTISQQPLRKRIKFIINHPSLAQEISLFQQLIDIDPSFEFGLKVINDQGDGLNQATIQGSRYYTRNRLIDINQILSEAEWGTRSYKIGSAEIMAPLLLDADVARCAYREEARELRFAYYREKDGHLVLKYRYCPYFPSDFAYHFHIDHDDLKKLERNFSKGEFHNRCQDCRFLNYLSANKQRTIVV